MWALLAEWRWVSFNPTLVRLRPSRNNNVPDELIEFQSHAGSIEANWNSCGATESWAVSIPRWFD